MRFTNYLAGAIVMCVLGVILVIVCRSLVYYNYIYYYVDSTAYTITHVFFWLGVAFFLTGLIQFVRSFFIRRQEFRGGITVQLGRPPPPPASVTVVGSVMPSAAYQMNERGYLQQPPFPTQQPPFPTQQPPFPTQQPPFPTQQPPFPTQQPPFPTQQPPFPTHQPVLPSAYDYISTKPT